ncbi:MAG: DJ-1/PfpI family protein [Saprospiraceae bacterium]
MKITFIVFFCFLSASLLLGQKDQPQNDLIFMCPPCGMPCDTAVHASGGSCGHCGMHLIAGYREMIGKSQRGHFQQTRAKKVAILLFPGVEIIDFAPEYEIFGQSGMRVFTVAERDTVVRTAMGLRILPDFTFENAPDADIVLLPGGHVDAENPRILAWIKKSHERAATILTVCNGAFFLASAGLLDGQTATTFNGALDELRLAAPQANVVDNQRFVDNGKIITSAGLAAGIDAAFHVLGEYEGVGRAQEVAIFLEYDWDAEGQFVRALLADRHVRPLDDALAPFMLRTQRYEGDRKHWTLEVLVTTELISIEKIVRLLEYQWQSGTAWEKTQQNGLDSDWALTADKNAHWKGEIRISPSGKDFVVRVMVQSN